MSELLPSMLALARIIGWALLHFIWQAALLGGVYWLVRGALPRGEFRYRFGMATLLVMAICPMLTVWRLQPAMQEGVAVIGAQAGGTVMASVQPTIASSPLGHDGLEGMLPWLVLTWICGVAVLSLRAWRQWRNLQMLVRMADTLPAWQQQVEEMAVRCGIRRHVTVLRSKLMTTPGVVGWFRPVILLPMAVVSGFPAAQIELVLAHELAHLRRWDPLANLFQVILETIYFFHPVVRWISREVRNEREICCDAKALTMTNGSRRELGNALVALGELRQREGALFLAASGGVLLDRVQVMLQPVRQARLGQTSARFVAVLLGALLMALTVRLQSDQRQLQRELTGSLTQWHAKLVEGMLLTVVSASALHIGDLAPVRMPLARPRELQIPQISVNGDDRMALPTITGWGFHGANHPVFMDVADEHPQPVPMKSPAVKSDSVSAQPIPVLVRRPVYPRDALARGVQGQVVIEFSLTPDGSVRNPRIISANPAGVFNMAALQAIDGWKYEVPSGLTGQRKYRQAMAFSLNATDGQGSPSASSRGVKETVSDDACREVTGTHICRQFGRAKVQMEMGPVRVSTRS